MAQLENPAKAERLIHFGGVIKHKLKIRGGQSTQIKYLSKSTDTYSKILLQ